jgi:hypothetical protein
VVARPEDEDSRQCAERFGDGRVRVVPVVVPAGGPGFVAALNAGVDASVGEIVCLTDDDSEPRPDWIARIVAGFDRDPSIGAVGGRDWVFHGEVLEDGEEPVVGTVTRWGRVIGRHHLGVGPPRDVAVLKGVNLSARGDLIRAIGFDRRLWGRSTEHHSELGLCLALRGLGYRVVYDPAIAVDHRPRPRAAEGREFGPVEARNAAHNETLALLEYLPPSGRAAHLLWTTMVGTRGTPGLAQAVRLLPSKGGLSLKLLAANLDGRLRAVLLYLRAGTRRHEGVPRAAKAGEPPSVLAVAHSAGAGVRARHLLEGLPSARVVTPAADARGMAATALMVIRSRARVLYLVDVGRTTAPAAIVGRLTGKRVIVDTGDATFALARSLGDRSRIGLAVVGAGEQLALRSAHQIVVRGRAHAARVPGPAVHIPDLAPREAAPSDSGELRTELGLEGAFVAGLVGSLILSPRLGISYGWDLIEALAHTDRSVVALIVGDGSGLEALRERAAALGVADRCRFVGRVPSARVGPYVCAMDVGISTQTNDEVGQVRTAAKLPLYLACGRPVLASHVGEAARLLGPHGWTIPYRGVVDRGYPGRLASALETWRQDPDGAQARGALALRLAADEFDAVVLRDRLWSLIAAG